MNRRLLFFLVIVILSTLPLLISGCDNSQGMGTVERPPVAVETVRVCAADLPETVSVVGTLAPKFEASVKAEYQGTVAEVYVTEWVRVKKGTPLARLDTRETEALVQASRANMLQAETASTRAVREYERALKLKEAGLMTQQGVDDAKSAADAAAAALDAARAQQAAAQARLDKAVLRAPMDGVVAMRAVSPGDYAGGDPVFRIIDTGVFDLKVNVPSSRICEVEVGQTLKFTTEAVPGRVFDGVVDFINPEADPASRTVQVIARVPNPEGVLKAGLFVKGDIQTAVRSGVLQVPKGALFNWDFSARSAEIFVVKSDTAARRAIRTGALHGDRVEVTSGLQKDEQVVTRGAFLLKDGDRVSIVAPEKERA
jgi:membrane fusion protein (multidrug efflux system)